MNTQAIPNRKVTMIPADPQMAEKDIRKKHLRVAPYCRVSTGKEEQLSSYEAQIEYYTAKIAANPEWTMVRIFADERIILGTSQEVLAPQGFPDLVLIFIWPEINGPYGRLIRKCVELSPLPIRRAA